MECPSDGGVVVKFLFWFRILSNRNMMKEKCYLKYTSLFLLSSFFIDYISTIIRNKQGHELCSGNVNRNCIPYA